MTLLRSDYDQAAGFLRFACELMEKSAAVQTRGLRQMLAQSCMRLTADNPKARHARTEAEVLRQAAGRARELKQPDAAMEIRKAVAVLWDRS